MSALRRYEILLPLMFNDGSPVPESLLAETFIELRNQFGAASWETQQLRGGWTHEDTTYEDNLTRLFVDVPTCPNTGNSSANLKKNSKSALIKSIFGSRRIQST